MRLKSIILIIFSFYFLTLFPSSVKALSSTEYADQIAPDAETNLYKYKDKSMDGTIEDLNCRLAGCVDSEGNIIKTGLLPTGGKVLASLYTTKPISAKTYTAHLLKNIGFPQVTKTYARESFGYNFLHNIIQVWAVFRNLAYSIYILIFVVIGFMIMLRTKINAQTVISIQSALPNLIVTLILITFSYAIVGFLVDIMYFLIYFLVYLSQNLVDPKLVLDRFLNLSAVGVLFKGRNAIVDRAADATANLFWGLFNLNTADQLIKGSSFFKLIIWAGLTVQMFKLIFQLLKSYLMLIIQTITAPLQILPNAIPGSKAFTSWLKKTASYLAPFPMVAALFLFGAIMVGPDHCGQFLGIQKKEDRILFWKCKEDKVNPFGVKFDIKEGQKLQLPPFIFGSAMNSEDITALIGIMVLMMAPAVAKMAQDFFQVKESPYTSEVMAGLGMGWQWGSMPARWFIKAKQQEEGYRRQAKQLGNIIKPTSVTGPGKKEIGT